jgi:hypothetical protein
MRTRVLDLDGSLTCQRRLLGGLDTEAIPLQDVAPRIRLACAFRSFHGFEERLATLLGSEKDQGPTLTFYGSGDFHHVSLALVRRQPTPCNLLVLDNHPDWMRGIPFLHCGTWLYHAASLAHVHRIFHVGGEVDFDNHYRWLAPWPLLRSGKITVLPAVRLFRKGKWDRVPHQPLRQRPQEPARREQVEDWLEPYRADLASRPLYVSLDKDVLTATESVVNWDYGHLVLDEVLAVLGAFLGAADGHLAGMDVVGDWSPVRVHGIVRRLFHLTEHPLLAIDPHEATRRNEALNLTLLDAVARACDRNVHEHPAHGPYRGPYPVRRPVSEDAPRRAA